MKKLILFLMLTGIAEAQDPSDLQFLPGGCQITIGKTCQLYRMPDTTNVYKSDLTDAYGIYEFWIPQPGVYRQKLTIGASTFWTAKFSYIPVVPIGGDSTSDAGAIIQGALDSLPSTGGIITLPPGTHLLTTLPTISKSNVLVKGTGTNCILKIPNSKNGWAWTVSNNTHHVIFRDFLINGNDTNQTDGGGISINGANIQGVTVENVRFLNTYVGGVVIANGASDSKVRNCIFDSSGVGSETSLLKGFGVWVISSCPNTTIEGNTFNWWSGTAAVRVATTCSKTKILDNTFRNNDRSAVADRRGIFVNGGCTYTEIGYNNLFNIDENAIFCDGGSFTSIHNNDTDSSGNHGIECNDDYSSVADNNVTRSRGNAGISFNNTIGTGASGNHVSRSNGRGIYAFAASSDSIIGFYANGNICWNNSDSSGTADPGIEVQGQDAATNGLLRVTTLTGNTCFDDRATKLQTYGISVTAQAAGPNMSWGLVIVGNNVGRNLTGAINDGSGGTDVIANNQTVDE